MALAAVTAVPLLGLLICIAATRTYALEPQTVRPAPSWLTGQLHHIGFVMPVGVAIMVIVTMFGAYLLALRHVELLSTRVVLTSVLAFNLIVLIGPLLFSTDLFSYQAYARMFVVYHINPYTHGPSAMQLDPLYAFIDAKWINTPSVYGPLFTLVSAAVAKLSIPTSELVFKLLAVGASLGIVALLWRTAKLRGLDPRRAIALFGLNPLVTLFGVGGAHNDLLMLLLMMIAIAALLRGRTASGVVAIVTAAALKLTGGILLPFVLASTRATDRPGAAMRRWRLLAGALGTAVVIVIPSFLVFGHGLLKMTGTLETVQHEGGSQSVPGLLLQLVGATDTHLIATVINALLVICFLWLLRRVWQARMDWLEATGWATLALLISAGQLLPWYVCWLIPIAALCSSRRLHQAAMWMTAFGVVLGVTGFLPGGLSHLQII